MTNDAQKQVFTVEDRAFLEEHFRAIAQKLVDKRLWRKVWKVEVDGCVFDLTVKGYPRKGTAIFDELERFKSEAADALDDPPNEGSSDGPVR